METSAAKFLAYLCYSEEEIAEIRARNAVVETAEVTEQTGFAQRDESVPKDTIELVDVTGPTFKGKMLIVHDPARVKVAVAPVFSEEASGVRVEDFAKQENAVAAINGGGFMDEGGVGKGGMPLGIVIKDGKLLNGGLSSAQPIVGFDQNNQLIVGTMTGQECLDRGIRDAVSFGPTFIVNGKAMEVAGSGGGLNPRTVLGQRADGAVLMLVIDGRQSHSIGATYKDCIDVMLQYGAVNAANLDGGSSSMLVYNGEVQNVCASLYGSDRCPPPLSSPSRWTKEGTDHGCICKTPAGLPGEARPLCPDTAAHRSGAAGIPVVRTGPVRIQYARILGAPVPPGNGCRTVGDHSPGR